MCPPADTEALTVYQIKEKFVYLAKTHFIQRCHAENENDDDSCESDLYAVPDMSLECMYPLLIEKHRIYF